MDIDGDGKADILAAPGQVIIIKEEKKDDDDKDKCKPLPPKLELERIEFNLKRFNEQESDKVAHKAFDKLDSGKEGTIPKDKLEEALKGVLTELGLNVEDIDDAWLAEQTKDVKTDADNVISRGETVKAAKTVFKELQKVVADMVKNPDDYKCEDEDEKKARLQADLKRIDESIEKRSKQLEEKLMAIRTSP